MCEEKSTELGVSCMGMVVVVFRKDEEKRKKRLTSERLSRAKLSLPE